MTTQAATHSDLAIPPGEYLEEVVEELGMTKDELARRMNRPAAKLSAIFKGAKAITPDTALQLEKVLGVPAHIWTGLETEYRLTLARQQEARERQRLKAEAGLITRFCYSELVRLGYVAKKTKPAEKVLELQRFFGVTSLKNLRGVQRYQVAFRRGGRGGRKPSPEATAAWLRIGELKAQRTECSTFDKSRLKAALRPIRKMTLQAWEEFREPLQRLLAEAGVALVLCPHLTRTYLHGATFWLGREKAVVMMTVRGKWADVFWFSLFHEIAHILFHDRRTVFLEGEDSDPVLEQQEAEADRFAEDMLSAGAVIAVRE